MERGFVYKFFHHQFKKIGSQVAKNPKWFVIVPIFISILLATGLQNIKELVDMEYFASVDDSKSLNDRNTIEKLFPMDISTNFELGRYTRFGRFGLVIVLSKNRQSVLQKEAFQEILHLNHIIQNISIEVESNRISYKNICVRNGKKCVQNDVLSLYKDGNSNITSKYPIDINNKYDFKFYGSFLGQVETDESGIITSAKAVRMFYLIDDSNSGKKKMAVLWEDEFLNSVQQLQFQHITVDVIVSSSIEKELKRTPIKMIPLVAISAVFIVIFAFSTCIVPDWIQGKPWTGLITCTSSLLAVASGFGLLAYIGLPYIFHNIIVPFLVIGVGMDDSFVLLSAWRRTDRKKSVEDRMGEAYSESAVAITITSLTNILSFIIGMLMTPFPAAKLFCRFAACCLFFDYIYQITFVGAWMSICGYAEEKNFHCLTFMPIKGFKDERDPEGFWEKLRRFTGHNSTETNNESFLLDIWKKIGNVLTWNITKFIVGILFIAYFSVSLWSATNITSEFESDQFVFYDSRTYTFLKNEFIYFKQYAMRIQIVVNQPVNYADPEVYRTLTDTISEFEATSLLSDSSLTESWLRSYHTFLNDNRLAPFLQHYNFTDKNDYIKILREVFLLHPVAKRFKQDIVFNENYTEIIASRFLLQTNYTESLSTFLHMWSQFAQKAKFSAVPFIVYHRLSYLLDSFRLAIPVTIQTLGVSAIVMAVISYLFFSSVMITFCILTCIISIAVGVLGFMHLWNVSLNIVSMTMIIMLCGFVTDYVSHVSCAYISSSKSPSNKLKTAVNDVGLPIFQASFTTLLGVIPLAIPTSFTFTVAFKIVFFLSIFSALHAIIFLPIVFCILEDLYDYVTNVCKGKDDSGRKSSKETGHVNQSIDITKIDNLSSRESVNKTESKL